MSKKKSLMNDETRRTIRRRARHTRTKAELVESLFDSFRHLQIDPWEVSLEDMKIAVVVAAHAVRESRAGTVNLPA